MVSFYALVDLEMIGESDLVYMNLGRRTAGFRRLETGHLFFVARCEVETRNRLLNTLGRSSILGTGHTASVLGQYQYTIRSAVLTIQYHGVQTEYMPQYSQYQEAGNAWQSPEILFFKFLPGTCQIFVFCVF